jgi:HSP20 family protein
MTMALVKHDTLKRDMTPRRLEIFDRLFDDWLEMFRRPVVLWPERDLVDLRLEEFTEEGALVIRAELPGIDPEKDVEISIEDGMLHIGAERRDESSTEERDYVRKEIRYGAFHRDLAIPKGVVETDVKATYKDGILEVRVPTPTGGSGASMRRIPITKS